MAGLAFEASERVFSTTHSMEAVSGIKAGEGHVCKSGLCRTSAGASTHIPNCPKCGSKKVWRNGYYTPMFGERVQRWFCRDCDFKFSDPKDLAMAREALQQIQTIESKGLKTNSDLPSSCQICVSETKNLTTELQSKTVPQGCELSIEQRQILQGKIVEFQWHLKKHNYSEDTYMPYGENLKFLVKNDADLLNVDSVKTVVTKLQKTDIRKYNLIKAYKAFMGYIGLKAELPTYTYIRTLPFIPRETEIDQLIAGCCSYSKQMSIFLQLLKETGARMGEAWRLTFGDIGDVAKTVSIKAEKGSNSRLNKISDKLIMLMFSLNKNAIPDPKQRVFSWKQKCYVGNPFARCGHESSQTLEINAC